MVANESHFNGECIIENPNSDPYSNVDHVGEEEEEEEETEEIDTLSFCDLPIYSDWSKDDQSSSSSSSSSLSSLSSNNITGDNYFEFFSEEWSTSTTASSAAAEDIIFCGKLIPYKPQPVADHVNQKRRDGLFRWNSDISCNKPAKLQHFTNTKSLSMLAPDKSRNFNKRNGFIISPVKSRWYLIMFGLGKFPMEMEMRDIRNRQSRRQKPPPTFLGSTEKDGSGGGGEKLSGGRRRSRKGEGLWGLLRALSCGGGILHVNAAAKA